MASSSTPSSTPPTVPMPPTRLAPPSTAAASTFSSWPTMALGTAMVGQELNVLAAAVLGGASLVGGIGTVGGVLLGVLLLAMLQNGLNLLGVSSYFFQIVIGIVILV